MTRTIARAVCAAAFFAASASFAQEAPTSAPATTDEAAWRDLVPNEPAPLPAGNTAGNDLAPLPVQSLPGDAPSSVEIPAPASVATTQPSPETTAGEKSPRKALWWALSGPIAGASVCALAGAAHPIFATDDKITYATMISSCLVVPILSANAGHIYAGETLRARKKTAGRLLWSVLAPSTGFVGGYLPLLFANNKNSQANKGNGLEAATFLGVAGPLEGATAGLAVGLGVASILAIREIIDAPKAARRYNKAHSLSEPSPAPKPEPSTPQPDLSAVHPALRIYPGF